MNNWEKTTLGEIIISANTGLDAIKRAPIVDIDTGIKCIRIQDISQSKKYENWGYTNVDEKNFKKFQLKQNDIIIARTGATIGVNIRIKNDLNAVYNNGLIRIRVNNQICNPIYLYYNIRTSNYYGFIDSISGGTSSQPNMQINALLRFEFNLPPLDEQKRIADVLSALDDKIEINNKINENLEAQAQAIFKQWFVDFEFPDEEGKPYKSNGGKFIDSELGEIPEGWKVGTLGDVIENTNTGLDAIRRAPIVEKETGLKCLRIQDLSQNKILDNWGNTKVEENDYKKFQLKRDDIIMARTCSPGKFILIREDLPSVFNNGLLRIKVNKMEMHPIILSLIFKTNDFIGFIDGISGGTSVQLNMKMGDMLMYKLIIPPYETQNKAIELLSAIDEIILKNQKEVITLVKTRDSLLPKLMNGEVRA